MSNEPEKKTILESLMITSDKVELVKPDNPEWQVSMDKSIVSTIMVIAYSSLTLDFPHIRIWSIYYHIFS